MMENRAQLARYGFEFRLAGLRAEALDESKYICNRCRLARYPRSLRILLMTAHICLSHCSMARVDGAAPFPEGFRSSQRLHCARQSPSRNSRLVRTSNAPHISLISRVPLIH